MPALTRDEVRPGLVAYLEEVDLRQSEGATWYEGKGSIHGPPERRPYVCFEVDGHQSKWAPVTTQSHTGAGIGFARVKLLADWRTGGDAQCFGNQWIREPAYLVDGANFFAGPIDVFVDASRNECSTRGTRAELSPAGVEAIRVEVARQQRRSVEVVRGLT
jgi:hypothetical protein